MREESTTQPIGRPNPLQQRLIRAIPPIIPAITGAVIWGCAMALSLYAGLEIAIDGHTSHRNELLVLYFAGGLISYPMALFFVRFAALHARVEKRFSAAFVSLIVATIGGTAALSAVFYGNGDPQSKFAGAAAIYQFAVIGIRHYLPIGIVPLLVASLWLARSTR